MKISENLRLAVTLLACLGMLSPVAAFGAPPTVVPTQKTITLQDTKLVDQALVGKVVDAQGNAVVNAVVSISQQGKETVQITTGPQGDFSVAGLTGGVYRVSTESTVANYRVWTANAAPPAATEGVLLVDYNSTVTRGQCGPGGCANSAPAYGAPVGVAAPSYGGGEVIYGSGGGCDGGAGAGVGNGGVVYGDGGAGGYVDGGYVDGGAGGYVDGGIVDGGYIDGGYAGGGVPCDGGAVGYGGGGGYVAAPAYGGGFGGGGGFLGFLSSPWVIGAGVAAAIAIPLALDDDDDDAGAGAGSGNGGGNNGGAS